MTKPTMTLRGQRLKIYKTGKGIFMNLYGLDGSKKARELYEKKMGPQFRQFDPVMADGIISDTSHPYHGKPLYFTTVDLGPVMHLDLNANTIATINMPLRWPKES